MPPDELVAALRATLGKMEVVLGTVADAIAWTDAGGRVQWCNRAFDALAGRPRLELLGRSVIELLPLERDGRPLAGLAELQSASGYALRRGNRSLVIEAARTETRVGGAASVVLVLRDVSERARMELELARRNSELESLLHVTSHDLKEPLRSIEGFAQLLSDQHAAALDAEARDFLRRVVAAAARLRRLLEDILSLSRARRLAPPEREVEAGAIVAEALARLEERVKETGASVRVATPLPRLKADPIWATQAVYNLLSNALKFAAEGRPPDVEIAAYPGPGHSAGLVVRDRGPGVPAGHEERIFSLFQRAVGREVEGTGAGLAIVAAVAERHGGRAWVRPRPGGGSEFILTFGP